MGSHKWTTQPQVTIFPGLRAEKRWGWSLESEGEGEGEGEGETWWPRRIRLSFSICSQPGETLGPAEGPAAGGSESGERTEGGIQGNHDI